MDRPDTPAPSRLVIASSIDILEQCASLLDTIEPACYRRPCPLLSNSTIGQHVRHLLDHFTAALDPAEPGLIDYDHRERDTPVERDPQAARSTILNLVRRLGPTPDPARPVRVRVMLNARGDEAILDSSLGRELAFAAHHAIHHHAMISAIAASMGLVTPDAFGKAPSTRNHQEMIRERPDSAVWAASTG
jgi:hypothetical protein